MESDKEGFDAVIQDYIDFVTLQTGMYMDALAGFAGHHTNIDRQVHRESRPAGSRLDSAGNRVIVWASYEDPAQPNVIHNRIVRAADYLAINAKGGSNERQHAWAVLVFLYTYWELETRPRLARAQGCEVSDIRSDIMGDLRLLRNVILHAKGIVRTNSLAGMKKIGVLCTIDEPLYVSFEKMKQIFVWIHQGCALLLFKWLGIKDAEAQAEQIVCLAIQNVKRNKPGSS